MRVKEAVFKTIKIKYGNQNHVKGNVSRNSLSNHLTCGQVALKPVLLQKRGKRHGSTQDCFRYKVQLFETKSVHARYTIYEPFKESLEPIFVMAGNICINLNG